MEELADSCMVDRHDVGDVFNHHDKLGSDQALPTLLQTPWNEEDAKAEVELAGGEDMQAAADFFSVLTGGRPAVTKREPEFYQRGDYKDFSLVRVVMGYGFPTLAALACTTFLFYRRDL